LSVGDQGPGIAAEAQPRIFERFYRVDAARTHDGMSDGGAGRTWDELVDDVVRAARVVATTRNVSIVVECVHPAPFTGDEDLIRRLIINVLDNAIRYSPPDGAVRVALDRAGADYVISVSDQGPGIAAEIQPRIFERFYRVDAARTHDGVSDGGAGLGLALARWIAQAHSGDIVLATSSRLGSTFVITLVRQA